MLRPLPASPSRIVDEEIEVPGNPIQYVLRDVEDQQQCRNAPHQSHCQSPPACHRYPTEVIEIPEELGRTRAWRDALLADPHVAATSPDEGELLAMYSAYREVLTEAAAAGIDVPVARSD